MMKLRSYDVSKDKAAILRIWREVAWLRGNDEGKKEALARFVTCGRAQVAEVNGEAECLVNNAPGTLRYIDRDLSFSGVMGVATSRVARKQGLASRLLALTLAQDVADGVLVAGLGIFEQGFYNQLGFGNGGYEHWFIFDPAQLRVDVRARIPRRITQEDWEAIHKSRLARLRGHGSLSFTPPEVTEIDVVLTDGGFGLGYCDGPDGELTHHIWCRAQGEHGPYTVRWMSYQTPEQFLELMALIRNLSDQVRQVQMCEPPAIQLQDIIGQPFRQWDVGEEPVNSQIHALANWQMRICDLPGCLAQTCLSGGRIDFNLVLTDPIVRFLPDDASWRGIAGDYVVTLGSSSGAEPGTDSSLPTLRASVGAFTRLWLGVRPATGLAVTDELSGPPELLDALDWVLRLPVPQLDWDF
ncbi:MAG: GNAT family N-acetyltransferase [Anaerolineae bacterium]|nr:GNAT family N-acetyltransferase [Anaerolineae bacterium]